MSTPTSLAAYDLAKPKVASTRKLIVFLLRDSPMTSDEIESELSRCHASVSARLSEMFRDGVIEPSGVNRKTRNGVYATAWRLAGGGK